MFYVIESSNLPNEKDKHSNGRQVAGSEWVKRISKRLDNLCDARYDPWTPKTAKSQTSKKNMFKPLMYRQGVLIQGQFTFWYVQANSC